MREPGKVEHRVMGEGSMQAIFAERLRLVSEMRKRYRLNTEEAEDCFQDACLRWVKAHQKGTIPQGVLESKSRSISYFYKTLRNTCINYIRREKRKSKMESTNLSATAESYPDASPSGRDMAADNELKCKLGAVLGETDARILFGHDVEEKTFSEIGKELSISSQAVGKRYRKARKAIIFRFR